MRFKIKTFDNGFSSSSSRCLKREEKKREVRSHKTGGTSFAEIMR
jgi:hypothetical protein